VNGYDLSPPNGPTLNRERRESHAIKGRNHQVPLVGYSVLLGPVDRFGFVGPLIASK
jgi:hypothetical protein